MPHQIRPVILALKLFLALQLLPMVDCASPTAPSGSGQHVRPVAAEHRATAADGAAALPKVLVYSRTAGYRHASIPVAINAISNISASNGGIFTATFSENPADFTDDNLAQYSLLAFLHNSDQILDDPGIKALNDWLVGGGGSRGVIGIHSASAALFNTSFYGRCLGAFFDYHPDLQNATFTVSDANHPSTSSLPSRWNFVEEVYNWRSDPRTTNITELLSVDPTSYRDPQNGTRPYSEGPLPQPIAWYREGGIDLGNGSGTMQGRVWYTALGHTNDTWMDPVFQGHILGGFQWVLAGLNGSAAGSGASAASTISGSPTSPPSSASSSASTASFASAANGPALAWIITVLCAMGSCLVLF